MSRDWRIEHREIGRKRWRAVCFPPGLEYWAHPDECKNFKTREEAEQWVAAQEDLEDRSTWRAVE